MDGFDEVPEGKQIVTLHYIENLARDYTRMKIGVTARPNAPITSSSHFRVMDLCFLDKGDYKAHVKKLAPDETTKEIFAGVQKSGIVHLLNTPLMVVLLVMRFKIDATVPENELAFYDDLFDLLARRHDKTKEGFRRERRSGKSDFALRRLLSGICYLAKKEALLEFHRTKLIDWAERIARSTLMQVDGELAIDDIANVTCLLLEEGGIYTYAHNTIREFFAAGFIKDSAQAPKFYGNCVEGWIDWAQVLSYLSLLDPLRFQKHFHLRHLQWLFSGDADTDLSRLSFNDRMTNFHRLHHLKILYDEHKKSVLRYRAFC
ncbi:MAG: hypothetical protein KDD60_13055, partial [Bdellovibrionales bacterium]|nr:hypothetical protein [Bdellovibrionales bacterium]